MADSNAMMNQLAELEKKIDAQISKARSVQTVSIVVGIILVVFMLGYFMFMSAKVRQIMNPDDIARMTSDQVLQQVETYKPQVKEMVKERAPVMVNQMIDTLIDTQIPAGRQYLEASIKEAADTQLGGMEEKLLGAFNEVMDQHGDNIKELGSNLKTDEGKQAFEDAIHAMILESLDDPSISESLDTYGVALQDIDARLTRLNGPVGDLTDEEQITRRLVMIIREMAQRSKLNLGAMPSLSGLEEAVDSK